MSARDFSCFPLMIMTSVGGRAHRGPVTRSAAQDWEVRAPGSARSQNQGFVGRAATQWRTAEPLRGQTSRSRTITRDGAAMGPADLRFFIGFQIAVPPPRVTCEKAGPRGP